MAIYRARMDQLEQELKILRSQHTQRVQEASEMNIRRNQVANDLKLAQKQLNIVADRKSVV